MANKETQMCAAILAKLEKMEKKMDDNLQKLDRVNHVFDEMNRVPMHSMKPATASPASPMSSSTSAPTRSVDLDTSIATSELPRDAPIRCSTPGPNQAARVPVPPVASSALPAALLGVRGHRIGKVSRSRSSAPAGSVRPLRGAASTRARALHRVRQARPRQGLRAPELRPRLMPPLEGWSRTDRAAPPPAQPPQRAPSSSSTKSSSSAVLGTEEGVIFTTPLRCSTFCLSRDNNMLKFNSTCSGLHTVTTILSTPHIQFEPLPVMVVDRGPRPSILNVEEDCIPPKPPWSVVDNLAADITGLACSSNCALFQSASHQVIFQCNHVSFKGANSYNMVFCISELVAVPIILHSVAFFSTTSKISHGQVCKPPKPPWLSCHELMIGVDVILILKGTIQSYTVGICQTYHSSIEFEVEISMWCYSWLMAFAIQIIMDIGLLLWNHSPTLLSCALSMDHQFLQCVCFFAIYPVEVQLKNFLSALLAIRNSTDYEQFLVWSYVLARSSGEWPVHDWYLIFGPRVNFQSHVVVVQRSQLPSFLQQKNGDKSWDEQILCQHHGFVPNGFRRLRCYAFMSRLIRSRTNSSQCATLLCRVVAESVKFHLLLVTELILSFIPLSGQAQLIVGFSIESDAHGCKELSLNDMPCSTMKLMVRLLSSEFFGWMSDIMTECLWGAKQQVANTKSWEQELCLSLATGSYEIGANAVVIQFRQFSECYGFDRFALPWKLWICFLVTVQLVFIP